MWGQRLSGLSLPSPKEFYERFKDNPEGAREAAFKFGQEMSQFLLRKWGIEGNNLETVAAVLNEFQRTVQGEPSARVEGNKITMRCKGLCPVMRAALTLNISWIWLDTNMAWPMIQGMASFIMPDIKFSVPSAKSKGDSACIYIFEK
jgi:hypothetical protein